MGVSSARKAPSKASCFRPPCLQPLPPTSCSAPPSPRVPSPPPSRQTPRARDKREGQNSRLPQAVEALRERGRDAAFHAHVEARHRALGHGLGEEVVAIHQALGAAGTERGGTGKRSARSRSFTYEAVSTPPHSYREPVLLYECSPPPPPPLPCRTKACALHRDTLRHALSCRLEPAALTWGSARSERRRCLRPPRGTVPRASPPRTDIPRSLPRRCRGGPSVMPGGGGREPREPAAKRAYGTRHTTATIASHPSKGYRLPRHEPRRRHKVFPQGRFGEIAGATSVFSAAGGIGE